uniref:Uncharacterized protein n=1 Tax=Arundo donax TaxID=35708 RepID=A0A0A9ADF7_ARUDO
MCSDRQGEHLAHHHEDGGSNEEGWRVSAQEKQYAVNLDHRHLERHKLQMHWTSFLYSSRPADSAALLRDLLRWGQQHLVLTN